VVQTIRGGAISLSIFVMLASGCSPTFTPTLPATGSTRPPTSPSATTSTSGSPEPSTYRCPALSVPADPQVACAELRDGHETYSDSAPRAVSSGEYFVIGECTGTGDLDELPYTLAVDDSVVSSGAIACRSGIVTKNSGFDDLQGPHRVSVRFAEGIGTNAYGHVVVTRG